MHPSGSSRLLRQRALATAVGLAFASAPGCSRSLGGEAPNVQPSPQPVAVEATDAPADALPNLEPYPPGRWRLVNEQDLRQVVLWVSHILIRHRDVPDAEVCFDSLDWNAAPPAPPRSRREAFEMAQQIAAQAKLEPERFAALARRHSEDVATRDRGGSFGGVRAIEYSLWPEVLDALAASRPGEVSSVVETRYGFHIFQLRPPPEEQTVSGARIIIGYDEAPWLRTFLARRVLPHRSRSEALALALRVYQEVRQQPERFADGVERYSDHEDAARAGDFGAWSTRGATPFSQAVELLAGLAPGEVAPPLDSPLGFQIIQRTVNRPRSWFAMSMIQKIFDPSLPAEHPESGEQALQHLRAISAALKLEPARFAEFRDQLCCRGVEYWQEGQEAVAAERALARLTPGQIGPEPVLLEPSRYAILERESTAGFQPLPTSFELPAPTAPDLDYFLTFRNNTTRKLAEARRAAVTALQLTPEEQRQLEALHQPGELATNPYPERRVAIVQERLHRMREVLGVERYVAYRRILERGLERELLGRVGSWPALAR